MNGNGGTTQLAMATLFVVLIFHSYLSASVSWIEGVCVTGNYRDSAPRHGALGVYSTRLDAFPVDPLDPLQSSWRPVLKQPSR